MTIKEPFTFGLLCVAAVTAAEPGPMFPIREHGLWGYMDGTGKVVVQPAYQDAQHFAEGLAR